MLLVVTNKIVQGLISDLKRAIPSLDVWAMPLSDWASVVRIQFDINKLSQSEIQTLKDLQQSQVEVN